MCFSALCLSPAAQADNFCPAPAFADDDAISAELNSAEGELAVVADKATLGNDGVTQLSGNVAMSQEGGIMRANKLDYDQTQQQVRAQDNVRFSSQELMVNSREAAVNLKQNQAQFIDAEFQLKAGGGRGSAAQIDIAADGSPDMRQVRYTTCPPGNESWILKAERIRLDQDSGQGKANSVSLRFKGVPIFYFPYLQFPFTDQRQSGLLAPSFGSSDSNGLAFGIPYYWNIAPNMDATFTPSFLSRRGWRLDSEYRFLTGSLPSARLTQDWWRADAIAALNWLPDDDVTGRARYLGNLEANARRQQQTQYWQWQNKLIDVKDNAWFDDFGSSLADVSQPFYVSRSQALWQRGDLQRFLRLDAVAEDHEPLSGSNTTLVSRQPELSLQSYKALGASGLAIGLDSQLSQFGQHGSSDNTQRLHYQPWLAFNHDGRGWWLRSQARYLNTRWREQNNGSHIRHSRSLPVYSANLGLHLEKTYAQGHHVIEPSVAFRAAPFREQSKLPVLDTHSETLYWHNLEDDQFSGLDRVRDGQQLSVSLASRWYDLGGQQRFGFRLGQLWYLDRSQVMLPGEAAVGNRSNTLFELVANIDQRWQFSTSGEWDSQQNHIAHSQLRAELQDPRFGDFYISLRQRRNLFRQLSIGGKRQLSDQWHADVSTLYSLDDNQFLEAKAKLRYQTCCWAIDFGGSRVLRDSSGEPDIGFFIQLELSGLAQIGSQ